MTFKLASYIDFVPGCPSVLIPVFVCGHSNIPFVQEMDEFYYIKSIVPFLDIENYNTFHSQEELFVSPGGPGIVAFRTEDGCVHAGTVHEMFQLNETRSLGSESVVLRVQLNRIFGTELLDSRDTWKELVLKVFRGEPQRKLWIDIESQSFTNLRQIWDKVDPKDISQSDSPQLVVSDFRNDEAILHWLSDRRYFERPEWRILWHYVLSIRPLDERVMQIGLNWIYATSQDDASWIDNKSVLLVMIDTLVSRSIPDAEFLDFLTDALRQSPEILFLFLKPRGSITKIMSFVARYADASECESIINFYLDEVPKESDALGKLYEIIRARIKSTAAIEVGLFRDTQDREVTLLKSLVRKINSVLKAERSGNVSKTAS